VIADSRINITPVDFSQLSPWKLRDSRLFRFVHVIAVVVDVVVGIVGRTEQRTPFVFGTRHDFPIAAGSPTFAICHEMNKDLMEVVLISRRNVNPSSRQQTKLFPPTNQQPTAFSRTIPTTRIT
jgi:hypothetical protein